MRLQCNVDNACPSHIYLSIILHLLQTTTMIPNSLLHSLEVDGAPSKLCVLLQSWKWLKNRTEDALTVCKFTNRILQAFLNPEFPMGVGWLSHFPLCCARKQMQRVCLFLVSSGLVWRLPLSRTESQEKIHVGICDIKDALKPLSCSYTIGLRDQKIVR